MPQTYVAEGTPPEPGETGDTGSAEDTGTPPVEPSPEPIEPPMASDGCGCDGSGGAAPTALLAGLALSLVGIRRRRVAGRS